ncbi:hypothetical protein EDD37DRAFT_201828 [Exophiala viscosa]|uniref:uncharacterized protein n=1 Tax=Exophiala viscosa TaxID=2486360 RepID=UPI00218D297D|nr:hypothetical protein EDD37DRAFT_201828 [Exophiala viscosa]
MANNNGTTSAHDQETHSAGDVLARLSRQAIISPEETEFKAGWDTWISRYHNMAEAADVLMNMSRQSMDRSDSTITAESTVSVRTQESPESTWFHALLQEQPLRDFIRLGLKTASLDRAAERKIELVLLVMTARSCVQEACWYLDENDWDIQRAISQYQSDEMQRIINPSQLYLQLNRQATSITSQNFNERMLFIAVPTSHNGKFFPGQFDVNNSEHLRALNQWQADMTRMLRGPPIIPDIVRKGYSPVEQRFMRNRFANDITAFQNGGLANWVAITKEFKDVFQGRYVPGETNPCPERMRGSITNYMIRHFRQGQTGQVLANYNAALRILAVREQEQGEYDAVRARSMPTASILEWDSWDSSSDDAMDWE